MPEKVQINSSMFFKTKDEVIVVQDSQRTIAVYKNGVLVLTSDSTSSGMITIKDILDAINIPNQIAYMEVYDHIPKTIEELEKMITEIE